MDIETFVRAATERPARAGRGVLAAAPELERDPWVRLVLGREWDGDPNAPGGPLGWAPLLYACHSCFETTALARELLERGADPNGFFVNEYGNMSALYGAAGSQARPGADARAARGGREPERRRVALPLDRGGEPRVHSGSCSSTARRSTARTRSRPPSTTTGSSTSA